MPDKDSFDQRRRAVEEDYFRKKDAELVEKMRRHSAFATVRQQIVETTGIEDEELIRDLQERGYTGEMVRALPLVPLIHIAWADGRVTDDERKLIIEMARARDIAEDSDAYRRIVGWLDRRPDEEVFDTGLRLARAMLAAMPAEQREASRRNLVEYCTAIASASGGLFGFGSISAKEAEVLERLSASLERARPDSVKRVIAPEE